MSPSKMSQIVLCLYTIAILGEMKHSQCFQYTLPLRHAKVHSPVVLAADRPMGYAKDIVKSKGMRYETTQNESPAEKDYGYRLENSLQYRTMTPPFGLTRSNTTEQSDVHAPKEDTTTRNELINKAVIDAVTDITKPLLGADIEHGVNHDVIKGAALTGASLAFLATGSLVTIPMAGLASAYVSIHPGHAGETARGVGGLAWKVGSKLLSTTEALGHLLKSQSFRLRKGNAVTDDEDIEKILADVREAEIMVEELRKINKDAVEEATLTTTQLVSLKVDYNHDEITVDVQQLGGNAIQIELHDDSSLQNIDLMKMTVNMLKEELRQRQLKVSGRKEELIERLNENLKRSIVVDVHEVNGDTYQITPVDIDWSKMTVVMLKEELRQRNLNVSGRKAELIKRLEDYLP